MASHITVSVKKHIDSVRGGSLVSIEPMKLLAAFPGLKRFYFIVSEPPIVRSRGGHYHKIKHEAMFAVKGIVKLVLKKKGAEYSTILSNMPEDSEILVSYVPPRWWHEVKFISKGAILGVLASTTYEEDMNAHDDYKEIP